MLLVGVALLICVAQARHVDTGLLDEKRDLAVQTVSTGLIDPYMRLSVRLTGGDDRQGRLETYMNGVWYSVCDDAFDDIDAHVACRQLGFSSGRKGTRLLYGYGERQVLLDELGCFGWETALEDCPHAGMGVHNCDGSLEGATVVCSSGISEPAPRPRPQPPVYPPSLPAPRPQPLAIQAVRLSHSTEGLVEVLVNNQYKSVCSDAWDNNDATVACRMLGYAYGEAIPNAHLRYGHGNYEVWMDEVNCAGTETTLDQCPHLGYGVHNCDGRTQAAGAICRPDARPPQVPAPSTPIILQNGRSQYDGALLMYHAGDYYPVCADDFTSEEATVICRQLFGFRGQASTPISTSAQYAAGFSRLQCSGNEYDFTQCRTDFVARQQAYCYYGDATIDCYP